jgi:hypothetical protein
MSVWTKRRAVESGPRPGTPAYQRQLAERAARLTQPQPLVNGPPAPIPGSLRARLAVREGEMRAAGAPLPTTPQEAEVERLEAALHTTFAAWRQVEGPATATPTRAEVDAAWAFKRALDAYEAAMMQQRAREATAEAVGAAASEEPS